MKLVSAHLSVLEMSHRIEMSSQDQHTIDDLNQLKNTFNHISVTI